MKTLFAAAAAVMLSSCAESTTPTSPAVIWVHAVTTGEDRDLDGYRISIDGELRFVLGSSTASKVENLELGTHTLEVDGIAQNCVLSGPSPREFAVTAGGTLDIRIEVDCVATGIVVTINSQGVDVPLGGFSARISASRLIVPSKGTTLVSRLAPGIHAVAVEPTENCQVSGGAQRDVVVENRKLTPVAFDLDCSAIPREIAFTSDTFSQGWYMPSLFTVSRTGAFYFSATTRGHHAAWSPDGKKLAYSDVFCDYYDTQCTGGLVVVDAATWAVDATFGAALAFEPAWSPDGEWIAFTSGKKTIPALVVQHNGRDSVITFARTLAHVGSPTWSPDGKKIAFSCAMPASQTRICVTTFGSSEFTELTTTGTSWEPAWSPDGMSIAFVTTQLGINSTIALMNPDGSNIRAVTAGRNPAWRPDGSTIVFSGDNGLFTVKADGSELTRITTGSHREPAWRP